MSATRHSDTVFAPATLPGTGAISIVRISGPETFRIVDSIVQLKRGTVSSSKGYTIHSGVILQSDGALLDEVLVSLFRAPLSYTGEDSVEISCHASAYIVSELMRRLSGAGARVADPGEFTLRAFMNGKIDLAQAEAVADVISSNSSASHRVAMNQLRGGYSHEMTALREQLLELTSLMELELDFSEEDVRFADRSRLLSLLDQALARLKDLTDSFHAGNAIKNGIPVVIAGPPNAGKSTLLNALIHEDRAIVSDIPGTTRDTLEETFTIDGILYRFIDTAGIRKAEETVERLGIERSFAKLSSAIIVIFVLDQSEDWQSNADFLEHVLPFVDKDHQKVILMLNKADLVGEISVNNFVTTNNKTVSLFDNKAIAINTSLKSGEGLRELKNTLHNCSTALLPDENATIVTNQRHFEALSDASSALTQARFSLLQNTPTDLVAEDLRSAISSLSRITGHTITPDEVLGNIFRNFCIGK